MVPIAFAAAGEKGGGKAPEAVQDGFAFQKEGPQQKSGNIFYSSTNPNQLLIKANVWGAVHFPGIHFLPKGTTLLDAVSIAGGPVDSANTDEVTLSTVENGKTKISELSLSQTLAGHEYNPELKPGDVVVVKRDISREKIGFFLSVGSFALSVIAVGLMVATVSRR